MIQYIGLLISDDTADHLNLDSGESILVSWCLRGPCVAFGTGQQIPFKQIQPCFSPPPSGLWGFPDMVLMFAWPLGGI